MKLKINEPCHEDWSKMTSKEPKIGMYSRHCDSCEKSVVDFTQNSRAEIIAYMISNRENSICGRMRADQFDFKHEDIFKLCNPETDAEKAAREKAPDYFWTCMTRGGWT